MTRDPVAIHVAQPIVNALHLDPANLTRRAAEIMLIAVVTRAGVDLATLDIGAFKNLVGAELFAVLLGTAVFLLLRRWAEEGPALLAGPLGPCHLALRFLSAISAGWAIYQITMFIVSGLAAMVPISVFRIGLDLAERLVTLVALYACICVRPPPRRRRETVNRVTA